MKKLFILTFYLLSFAAQAQEPITLHVAELPKVDIKEHILWLNPPEDRSTADGESPLVRYNTQSWPTTLGYMGSLSATLEEPVKLFAGWSVQTPENLGCLNHTLVLKKDNIVAKFNIKQNRNSGFFERRASCIGGKATVYKAVYLNTQYIAFSTSEPGWIFFDYKNAKFLPFIIGTNPNHNSNLFATQKGKILIEIQVNSQGKTNSTGIDKEANGLREITVNNQSLEAPLNPLDFVEIKKIQKENQCAIEKKNNRTCN